MIGYVSMLDSGDLHADAQQKAEKLKKKAGKKGQLKTPFEIKVRLIVSPCVDSIRPPVPFPCRRAPPVLLRDLLHPLT